MTQKFKIADWTIHPKQCLLINRTKKLKLETKAMALLVALAKAEGALVSRQQLFDLLWPNQNVTDYALNTLISNLRKNLGSSVADDNLIETRPKLGYRLTAEIEWIDAISAEEMAKKKKLIVFIVFGLLVITLLVITSSVHFNASS